MSDAIRMLEPVARELGAAPLLSLSRNGPWLEWLGSHRDWAERIDPPSELHAPTVHAASIDAARGRARWHVRHDHQPLGRDGSEPREARRRPRVWRTSLGRAVARARGERPPRTRTHAEIETEAGATP